ncbi:MAG: putative Ig domain-containing protein, partial [Rhodospirillales bacterium]|nr:putative Ig domain-containing protein [Rhodospirillales bacterium]
IGAFSSVTLRGASGGVQPYTYSFTCAGGALPSGMGFAPATRVLAGTPDAAFRDSCTYTATDSSQPAVTVSRAIEVTSAAARPLALPDPPDQEFVIGAFSSVTLRGASGGVQPYTYSFTCAGGALPSGMSFAPATRVLAGTPDAAFRDSCTYTATDSSEPSVTVSQAVEVTIPEMPLTLPEDAVPEAISLLMQERADVPPFAPASGGVQPYTYEIVGCTLPDGLSFSPDTLVLSGTPLETYRGPDCTYRVTDSDSPPASVSRGFELIVDPLDLETWRFRTRTVEPGGPCTMPEPGTRTRVAILPHAQGGKAGEDVYNLIDFPRAHFLDFDADTRRLTYIHPSTVPILGTPNTYRYLVANEPPVNAGPEWWREYADDVLCLDVQFDPGDDICPDPAESHIHINLRIRDDAYWDENVREYRCPDTTAPAPRSAAQSVSNPVHTALAPVHARRAVDAAHSTVRDRVRGWSPGDPQSLAISPSVDFASLSGVSGSFDYTGSSQSLSAGAELGAGSWQAGLVAAFTRTDLRYRAEAGLSRLGYRAGEHDTEIFSVHPFAAWHAPSGGHLWASLGAGLGDLRHRDDLGFPSWSSSDVRLRAYALGGSVPLADVLSGDLDAEAGIESFVFEVEGGGRISTSLPTLRGRDYRAGLAWSAPLRGAPFLSLAYRRLTGDGPEGARVEAQGSVSAAGMLDPRLTLRAIAEASFGLGDYEQDSWRLGGGVRFAPDVFGRGFGLDLDTRLMSPAEGRSAGIGMRGEAGYGLWNESFLGIVRPYVGLIRYPSDGSVRRTVGFNLRDESTSQFRFEVYDHYRDRSPALRLTLRHRL